MAEPPIDLRSNFLSWIRPKPPVWKKLFSVSRNWMPAPAAVAGPTEFFSRCRPLCAEKIQFEASEPS